MSKGNKAGIFFLFLCALVAPPVYAEAAPDHAPGVDDPNRPTWIPAEQITRRFGEHVNACLAGRPSPAFDPNAPAGAPTITAPADSPSASAAADSGQKLSQTDAVRPATGSDGASFDALKKIFTRCNACHKIAFSGTSFADAKLRILGGEGSIGEHSAAEFKQALEDGKMSVAMSKDEKAALEEWVRTSR